MKTRALCDVFQERCGRLSLRRLGFVLTCAAGLQAALTTWAGSDPGPLSPTTLHPLPLAAGQFQFTFPTVTGSLYRVEYRPTLGLDYWHDVDVVSGTGAVVTVAQPLNPPSGFYRVATEDPALFNTLTGEDDVASQAGPPEALPLPEPTMPDESGQPPATPANIDQVLLGVIERTEQSLQSRLASSNAGYLRFSVPTNAVRTALVPLYMRTLRSLLATNELENAIRFGLPEEPGGVGAKDSTNVLSDDVVTNVLSMAQQILAGYDSLVQRGLLVDDLPQMDPPPTIPGTNAPITVNPEFAKLFLRRLAPTLGQRLEPVADYLVAAMSAQETNGVHAPKDYKHSTINWLRVLRETPGKLKYFNGEGTEWANQWGYRARLPRFWLVEKHDPGATAEPYFVKLVSNPALDLSRSGSYGKGYKSGKVMAVTGEVTQEYPLKQGEQRGLNPPDNFITPRGSWTAWTPTYGLPITFSAQCWEQDWTRRSDVIEGVRRAAEKAEREVTKKFFDSVMEGFLQELSEKMKESAQEAFEHYRNEIIKKLRDLMKQATGAESVAEYLSKLLGVDVATLVAGLNFLFDPSADHAMTFMKEAFGSTIVALLAGGPLGLVLDVVLNILGKAFEQADNFLDFVKGILDGILDILGTILNLIIELLKFKDFFRDIMAMLNGDDLLGTATATLEGDTGNIKFSGWRRDEYRRDWEYEKLAGKFMYDENRSKSVVKAQFDLDRVMQHQYGERQYLVAKDCSGIPNTLGYEFVVKTKGIVAVEVTRWDTSRPFPNVCFHAGGNAYYRTTTSTSSDGTWRRVEVNARPIGYGRTMKVYLQAPNWDQPYAQAGRMLVRVDHTP